MLYLNVPERNCPVSDTQSLNQHSLLSCAELDSPLVLHRAQTLLAMASAGSPTGSHHWAKRSICAEMPADYRRCLRG